MGRHKRTMPGSSTGGPASFAAADELIHRGGKAATGFSQAPTSVPVGTVMPPTAVVSHLLNECELLHLRLAYGSDQSSHASLQRVASPVNQVGWGHRYCGRSVGGSSLWSLVGRNDPKDARHHDCLCWRCVGGGSLWIWWAGTLPGMLGTTSRSSCGVSSDVGRG